MNEIMNISNQEKEYMVQIRRELHQHPELSLQEKWTSERICQELDKLNIPYVIVGDYGIVATIEGLNTKNMVALRADMDALPIQENNDHLSYKSQIPNVMHACGHDAHVSMLLGAARVLLKVKEQIKGSVKLCFQQAEEVGRGAEEILEELAKSPIKSVFGIHIWSEVEFGTVAVEVGARMSGSSGWTVVFTGKGTHGAIPEDGISPIVVGSAFIQNINNALAYEVSPLKNVVLTVGKFHSGFASNVIPETATISGTIRTFSPEDSNQLREILNRIAKTTAETFRASVDVTISKGSYPVVNDPHCTKLAQESVVKLIGEKGLAVFHPLMPSENYGSFVHKYPGLMAFVGCKNDSKQCNFAHHHPSFNIDEDALAIGAALHSQYTIDFLNQL